MVPKLLDTPPLLWEMSAFLGNLVKSNPGGEKEEEIFLLVLMGVLALGSAQA